MSEQEALQELAIYATALANGAKLEAKKRCNDAALIEKYGLELGDCWERIHSLEDTLRALSHRVHSGYDFNADPDEMTHKVNAILGQSLQPQPAQPQSEGGEALIALVGEAIAEARCELVRIKLGGMQGGPQEAHWTEKLERWETRLNAILGKR